MGGGPDAKSSSPRQLQTTAQLRPATSRGGEVGDVCVPGVRGLGMLPNPQPGQPPTSYNFANYGETKFELCLAVEGDSVDIFSWFNGVPQQLQGARRIRMFDVLLDPTRTAYISMPRELDDSSIRVKYGGF